MTLIVSLIQGLEYGIVVGIVVSLCFVFYNTARPQYEVVSMKILHHDVICIVPDQSLVFAASDHFKYVVIKHVGRYNDANVIVINGQNILRIDVTLVKNLENLVKDMHAIGKSIILWNWKRQPIGVVMRLNPELGELFHNSDSLEQILEKSELDRLLIT